jgi:hypothetical protein
LGFSSYRNLSSTCLCGGAAFAVQPTAWTPWSRSAMPRRLRDCERPRPASRIS